MGILLWLVDVFWFKHKKKLWTEHNKVWCTKAHGWSVYFPLGPRRYSGNKGKPRVKNCTRGKKLLEEIISLYVKLSQPEHGKLGVEPFSM